MNKHILAARKNVNYWSERFLADFTEGILEIMEKKKINKNQLSKRMGVSREYIYKLFNYVPNMTVETMFKVVFSLGYTLHVQIIPIDENAGNANKTNCIQTMAKTTDEQVTYSSNRNLFSMSQTSSNASTSNTRNEGSHENECLTA